MSTLAVLALILAVWVAVGLLVFACLDKGAFREMVEGVTVVALWPLVVFFEVHGRRRRERHNRAIAVVRGHNDVHRAVDRVVEGLPDDTAFTEDLLDAVRDAVEAADSVPDLGGGPKTEYESGFGSAASAVDDFRERAQEVLDGDRVGPFPSVADLRSALPHHEIADRFLTRRERKMRRARRAARPGTAAA